MKVPCCHAIHMMVKRAVRELKKDGIDIEHYIVRVASGNIEPYKYGVIDESIIGAERKAHEKTI